MDTTDIDFKIYGIAELLNHFRLRVPPNQREYSWETEQVGELLSDISNAMRSKGGGKYFLGTIVLTTAEDGLLEVADGQQRLATTTMILACIRDYFRRIGDEPSATHFETEYLFKHDPRQGDIIPQLRLNLDDHGFFKDSVLQISGPGAAFQGNRRSHHLINSAVVKIREYFKSVEEEYGQHSRDILLDWVDYLKSNAMVVSLRVADKASAYVMFETLNDRGIKSSQADLVKNYLFSKSGSRIDEAQLHWSRMRGALDTIGSGDDLTLDFLRLAGCLLRGATREREIMGRVEDNASNQTEALKLLTFLDKLSIDYAAILNPEHPKWNGYPESVRESLKIIVHELRVTQIRPLILAIVRHFTPARTAIVFQRLIAWSVRILIEGTRGGRLDDAYARLANQIHRGDIKTPDELTEEAMGMKIVPSDASFQNLFEQARVSVSRLGRYYLRALENTARGIATPEFIPNESVVINLEHIMSDVPSEGISVQDIQTHYTRVGNLALLLAETNSVIGSQPFSKKKDFYRNSSFILTQEVATYRTWTKEAIEKRQKELAKYAVKTWPIK